jgi:hypothetical protein|tara:strand:- start:3239 stop:4507 length:1269 start_codon:yes stop_codon:yes gene_type:complete
MADNLNEETQMQDSTTVEELDVNLDEIFGNVGAENVMLPNDSETEEEKKSNLFSKPEEVDTTFIDKTESKTAQEKIDSTPDSVVEEALSELDEAITAEETDDGKPGKRKSDKNALVELANKMIEEGTLFGFDDDKDLEDYSTKDFRELFEANFQDKESKIREDTPKEFFNSLPEELQVAAKYVADGGTDLKGLFRTLSHVEEVMDLDPDNENHQAEIARQYLTATNFGSPEEIQEEIETWYDIEKLGKKAHQFKPKLDAMQEKIVAQKLAEQEHKQSQQDHAAKEYMDNVYTTLSEGSLGDLKLDKKVQNHLYAGLVQPNYPSISGKPTNLLGHLLEKYQFVEPRHDLIAEALWLLSDPDGYKNKVKNLGSQDAVANTVRQLKTAQSKKNVSSSKTNNQDSTARPRNTKNTVQRKNNMFKRF